MERAHSVTTVVFDKTGTLTRGRMVVAEVRTFGEGSSGGGGGTLDPGGFKDHVLACAAAVEASSEHPVAGAVLEYAAARLDPAGCGGSAAPPAEKRREAAAAAAVGHKRNVEWLWPATEVENDHGAP